jgi:hypothetical protein
MGETLNDDKRPAIDGNTNTDAPEHSLAAQVGNREELERLMVEVDKMMPSPEARAIKLWNLLPKDGLNLWDLVCFCTETLGHCVAVFPQLEAPVKDLNLRVFAAHYSSAKLIKEQMESPEMQLTEIKPKV